MSCWTVVGPLHCTMALQVLISVVLTAQVGCLRGHATREHRVRRYPLAVFGGGVAAVAGSCIAAGITRLAGF